jgi:Ca-activated chloride channel family protein
MGRVGRFALILALSSALGSFSGAAQFTARTDLVEVYVSVTDGSGRPLDGLAREAFHVRDNGVERPIAAFAAGSLPLSMAVVLDRSFSMRGPRLGAARAGALALLEALRADDRVDVLAIGSDIETLATSSVSREAAREAVRGVTPWGTSPIVDAIRAATSAIHGRPGRRAIVLFTDGEDRDDETTRRDALDAVRRSDALVYAVAVGSREPTLLEEFASASGGRVLRARDDRAAADASGAIAGDLQHQYLLGVAPADGPPGWHALSVTVEVPRAAVRARQGYMLDPRPAGASLERPVASKLERCDVERTIGGARRGE